MMQVIVEPKLRTNRLGGVDVPSVESAQADARQSIHLARCRWETHPRSGGKDSAATQR